MNKLEKVGEIEVDAGIVMVGDPCYHLHREEGCPSEFGKDWGEFVELTLSESPISTQIGNGLAVVIGKFGGDGRFPVYIRRGAGGFVSEVVIKFDAEDNENG